MVLLIERLFMQGMHKNNSGFTIVEVVTSLVLASTVLLVMIGALYTISNDAKYQKERVDLTVDTQVALDIIERDARFAIGSKVSLPSQYSDFFGPGTTRLSTAYNWSHRGAPSDDVNNRVLMMSSAATTTHPWSRDRTNVYLTGYDSISCYSTARLALKPRLLYYTVYFVRDGVLYRRIITDRTSSTCSNLASQRQRQTCPQSVNLASYSDCQAYDEAIVDNVSKFTVDYYDDNRTGGTPTVEAVDVYATGVSAIAANNMVITLERRQDIAGDQLITEKKLYVTQVNN